MTHIHDMQMYLTLVARINNTSPNLKPMLSRYARFVKSYQSHTNGYISFNSASYFL